MKKNIGIWIDKRQAHIVDPSKDEAITTIVSNVDEGYVKGGYGGAVRHLPNDAVSDTKRLNRKHEQEHRYFQDVMKQVQGADQLYIIGPGETRKTFETQLSQSAAMSGKVKSVEAADIMTPNQLVAKVREFFE